jgi:hypothetical protein
VCPLTVVFLALGASSESGASSDPDSSCLSLALPFTLEGFAGEEARGVSSSLLDDSA